MKPLSDPLNSLPLVGGLLMWYPSLPVLSKELAGAAAIPRGEPCFLYSRLNEPAKMVQSPPAFLAATIAS